MEVLIGVTPDFFGQVQERRQLNLAHRACPCAARTAQVVLIIFGRLSVRAGQPIARELAEILQASVRNIVACLARGVVFADDFRGHRTCRSSMSRRWKRFEQLRSSGSLPANC